MPEFCGDGLMGSELGQIGVTVVSAWASIEEVDRTK